MHIVTGGIPGSSAGGKPWCYWTIRLHPWVAYGYIVAEEMNRGTYWRWERKWGNLPWYNGFLGHRRLWDACCRLPLLPVWSLHLLWWPVGANLSHEVSCTGRFVSFLQYVDHSESHRGASNIPGPTKGKTWESYPSLLWEYKPPGVYWHFYRKNRSPKLQKGAAEWKELNQWYQHNLHLPHQLRRHGAVRAIVKGHIQDS